MATTKVITGKVRFNWLRVFEPSAVEEGGKEKYSVSLIIDKNDKETISKIEAAVQAAIEEGKTKLWGGEIPKKLKMPLRDGDEDKQEDEAYAGSYFLSANSVRQPGLVDANLQPIFDRDELYSGCYGRASISIYPFTTPNGTNKGIAVGLNNLQKLEDGPNLAGGGSSAAADFGDELM